MLVQPCINGITMFSVYWAGVERVAQYKLRPSGISSRIVFNSHLSENSAYYYFFRLFFKIYQINPSSGRLHHFWPNRLFEK